MSNWNTKVHWEVTNVGPWNGRWLDFVVVPALHNTYSNLLYLLYTCPLFIPVPVACFGSVWSGFIPPLPAGISQAAPGSLCLGRLSPGATLTLRGQPPHTVETREPDKALELNNSQSKAAVKSGKIPTNPFHQERSLSSTSLFLQSQSEMGEGTSESQTLLNYFQSCSQANYTGYMPLEWWRLL